MLRFALAAIPIFALVAVACRRESGPCPDGASLRGDRPPNGSVQWCERADGVKDGRWVEWYANGGPKNEGSYARGKMEGRWVSHFEDGVVHVDGVYRAGLKDGEWMTFYENGVKNRLDVHRAGSPEVKWTAWREDGPIWAQGTLLGTLEHGAYTEFHASGIPAVKGEYDHGKKVGEWLYFDAQGNPTAKPQGDFAH